MLSMTLDGADRLQNALGQAQRDLSDLSPVHARAARTVRSSAVSRAPRRTGRLASSQRDSATATEAVVSSNLVYAGVIHYGWPAHNIHPQPWLTETAERTQSQWEQHYWDELDRIVDYCAGGP